MDQREGNSRMKYTTGGFAVDELGFVQHVAARVLVAASHGGLDLNRLAREELAQRGLDQDGVWVGPERAELALCEVQDCRASHSSMLFFGSR